MKLSAHCGGGEGGSREGGRTMPLDREGGEVDEFPAITAVQEGGEIHIWPAASKAIYWYLTVVRSLDYITNTRKRSWDTSSSEASNR